MPNLFNRRNHTHFENGQRFTQSPKEFLLSVLLALAAVLAVSSSVCAQQATLTDDAYFDPGGNNVKALVIQGSNAGPATTFVKFKLTGTSPGVIGSLPSGTPGSFVARATVKLFVQKVNTPGTFDVFRVTSAWTETIASAPTHDTTAPIVTGVQVSTAGSFVTIDITPLVQQWLGTDGKGTGGVPNFGIALVASASKPNTDISFDSKETTTTSHLAQLDIVLNHAATADSATSVTGPVNANQISGKVPSAANADTASAVTGTVNASQVSGALTNATLDGSKVTGTVASAVNATTAATAGTVSAPLNLSGSGNVITGTSNNASGVTGVGSGPSAVGVTGSNSNGTGVSGISNTGTAVDGTSNNGIGVVGRSNYSTAIYGETGNNNIAVYGYNKNFGPGVRGYSNGGFGVSGTSNNGTAAGIYGNNTSGGPAGQFDGSVTINGNLNVTGSSDINTTGNAATVTNGVYTTGNYADPSWLTSLSGAKISGSVRNAANADNATNAGRATIADTATSASTAGTATNFTGALTGDVAGPQNATVIRSVAGSKITGSVALADIATSVLNAASDPSTATAGQIYLNTTENAFRMYDGSTATWRVIGSNVAHAITADTANALATNATVQAGQINGKVANAVNADTATSAISATTAGNASTVTNGVYTVGDQTIAGNKTFSNDINTNTQYNIGGTPVLSIGTPGTTANVFVGAGAGQNNTANDIAFFGFGAGQANTAGVRNAFFGSNAGRRNTTGGDNVFFGAFAGALNTTGSNDSFFGVEAGQDNTTGDYNSFFGSRAGISNTTGRNNSFFGNAAGQNNTTGTANAFFGYVAGQNATGGDNAFFGGSAGQANTSGTKNSFFGSSAGLSNTVEDNNTFVGAFSNGAPGITNATAIGAGAQVTSSNTLVLGTGSTTVQIPGTLSAKGSGFTNLNASNISSGTLDNARLGVIPIGNGGTGSARQNFVDLSSDQAIGGNKGFTNPIAGNVTGNAGTVTNGVYTLGDQTIDGNKTFRSDINTATRYSIGGTPVLSIPGNANIFAGSGAGRSNTTGVGNAFFGDSAGSSNTTGAGNSFFGGSAGLADSTGNNNAFFGYGAGGNNTIGNSNSFFGLGAGSDNTSGGSNAFFGLSAGGKNITGSSNVFFGTYAGVSNTIENNNTFIGASTNGSVGITNATAIGANATVTQSNSLVLGSLNGVNGATADTNVGIGTTAPTAKFHVQGGHIYVGSPGFGIILKSPDGSKCGILRIDNAGAMVFTSVTCP